MSTTISRSPATVGDLMTRDPIVVAADAPLRDAAELMDYIDISGLPVVGPDGELVGVISQTDLSTRVRPSRCGRTGPGSRCAT